MNEPFWKTGVLVGEAGPIAWPGMARADAMRLPPVTTAAGESTTRFQAEVQIAETPFNAIITVPESTSEGPTVELYISRAEVERRYADEFPAQALTTYYEQLFRRFLGSAVARATPALGNHRHLPRSLDARPVDRRSLQPAAALAVVKFHAARHGMGSGSGTAGSRNRPAAPARCAGGGNGDSTLVLARSLAGDRELGNHSGTALGARRDRVRGLGFSGDFGRTGAQSRAIGRRPPRPFERVAMPRMTFASSRSIAMPGSEVRRRKPLGGGPIWSCCKNLRAKRTCARCPSRCLAVRQVGSGRRIAASWPGARCSSRAAPHGISLRPPGRYRTGAPWKWSRYGCRHLWCATISGRPLVGASTRRCGGSIARRHWRLTARWARFRPSGQS